MLEWRSLIFFIFNLDYVVVLGHGGDGVGDTPPQFQPLPVCAFVPRAIGTATDGTANYLRHTLKLLAPTSFQSRHRKMRVGSSRKGCRCVSLSLPSCRGFGKVRRLQSSSSKIIHTQFAPPLQSWLVTVGLMSLLNLLCQCSGSCQNSIFRLNGCIDMA